MMERYKVINRTDGSVTAAFEIENDVVKSIEPADIYADEVVGKNMDAVLLRVVGRSGYKSLVKVS